MYSEGGEQSSGYMYKSTKIVIISYYYMYPMKLRCSSYPSLKIKINSRSSVSDTGSTITPLYETDPGAPP